MSYFSRTYIQHIGLLAVQVAKGRSLVGAAKAGFQVAVTQTLSLVFPATAVA
jgi:hypothetical protein